MYRSVQETQRLDSVQMQLVFGDNCERMRSSSATTTGTRQDLVDICSNETEGIGFASPRNFTLGSTPREGTQCNRRIPTTSLSAGTGSACASQIWRRSDMGRLLYARTHIDTERQLAFIHILR